MQFGHKLRIVGQLELARPVRLEDVSAPDPLYRAYADPGRLRRRRISPVTGRRWACQCQRDHTFSHLRAQRRNARSPCLVPPKPSGSFVAEKLLPTPDHCLGLPMACMILAGHDHQWSEGRSLPASVLLRAVALGDHGPSLLRSARLNWIFVRSCIPQTRIASRGGSPQANRSVDVVH